MSVSAIVSGIGKTAGSDSAMSQLSQDYNSFMKLLVAQVKYQDPLQPMESTEFVSQIAQLTQVEQAVLSNKHMESLREQLAMSGALFETALIGREVTVPTDTLTLSQGSASFAFELENSADAVIAKITDSSGNLVTMINLGAAAGGTLYDREWTGTDSSGNLVPDGEYRISLSIGGDEGVYSTYSSSTVIGIDYTDGAARLRLANGSSSVAGDVIRAR